jgi:outer membrane biosynthesis protein TonB
MAVGYGGTETMAQPASANRKRVMVGLIVMSFLLVVVAMASGSAPSNAPVSLADKIAEVKSLAADAKAVAAPVVATAAAPPKAEEAKPAATDPKPVVAAAAAPEVEAPKAAPVVEKAKKAIAAPAPTAPKVAVAAKQAKIQHLLDTRRVKLADTNSTEAPEAVAAGDAAPEAAAAAEPKASEGESKSAEGADGANAAGGSAFNSPMGNLNPTGIMSVFFNEKIMLTALGVIGTLLVLICCFARNADCALS